MLVKINKGCTGYSTEIDGEVMFDTELNHIALMKLAIFKIMRDKINSFGVEYVLKDLAENYGNFEYDSHSCDQCGDTGYEVTIEI